MTISTIHSKGLRRGFSLVEVMVATTLSAIIMAGVMSTFLMLGRSGANIANYNMMESQSRRALEEFSQDIRMASAVIWNSTTSVTLTVPGNYTPTAGVVTYFYDASAKTFCRTPRDSTSAAGTQNALINNIVTFNFARYDRINNPATLDTTTKRIQFSMTARTSTRTAAGASNVILSASYILRNKYAN
jgi:prepilin-type N-terminal cleavage/methylation domain-containing protein